MQRARIIIKGDVQMVGFRGFVIDQMKSLNLKGYVGNLPDETVEVLCEGPKNKIEELIAKIKETPPHFAKIDNVETEWQEYIGDLKEPERRGEDVPKEGATLDDLLVVLKSFDKKAEVLNERVGDVASNTESIISNTKSIISNTEEMATTLREFRKESGEKQDQMLGKQDQMLEKQDQTIEILGGKIDNVSNKIDNMGNKLDSFHQDTVQKFDTLRSDYGRISKDIAMAVKGIERVVQNTEKLLEKSERDRAGFEKSMDKVANAILALAKSKS